MVLVYNPYFHEKFIYSYRKFQLVEMLVITVTAEDRIDIP